MAINSYLNLITGEANLSVSAQNTGNVIGSASWNDVGATQNGIEMSWEPNMVDIEVDQFGDAARVIQSKIKVMIKTSLAEVTLSNLAMVWGYTGSYGSAAPGTGKPGMVSESFTGGASSGASNVLRVGIHAASPEERFIRVIGPASGHSTGINERTRTFVATRALSASTSAGSWQRNDNYKLPVEFRILPDQSKTGQEYGTITDVDVII